MGNKNYSISVVIPLYNKEECIERCIRSVLRQKFSSFDLIIVDDGSTDGAVQRIKTFDDPRIRLYTQENCGAASARNLGILKSKSNYIAFIDADDEWEDDHLETVHALYQAVPNAVLFGTAYQRVSNGQLLKQVQCKEIDHRSPTVRDYVGAFLKTMPLTNSSSTVVRKDVLEYLGGFPTQPRFFEDWNVWLKSSLCGPVAYSCKVTVSIHTDAPNRSGAFLSPETRISSIQYLAESLGAFASCKKALNFRYQRIVTKLYVSYIKKCIIDGDWAALKLIGQENVRNYLSIYVRMCYLSKLNRVFRLAYFVQSKAAGFTRLSHKRWKSFSF